MSLLLASLPDHLVDWRGTAAELAETCNDLLPRLNLEPDSRPLNERLVRYYVTEGVLSPPEREGREARFAFRQVIELLVTRYLLADGWPLAKIAALVQSADLAALQNLVPTDRPRTQAEEAISRLKRQEVPSARVAGALRPSASFAPHRLQAPAAPPRQARLSMSVSREAEAPTPALEMAAQLTRRKAALQDNLKALGNPEGRLERRPSVRIALAPWCEVVIDTKELNDISDEMTEILGTTLTQALQEERMKRGETK